MKLFLLFLKRYAASAAVLVVFSGIFALVFSLYDLHAEAVIYACALCAAVGIVIIAVKFILFRRDYLIRQRLIDEIGMLAQPLPEAKTPEQQQYNEIISMLRNECGKANSKYKTDRTEMLDYFTTWVHQIKIPVSVMYMTLGQYDSDEHNQLAAELMRIDSYIEMVLCYFRLDESAADLVAHNVSVDEVIRKCVRKYASVFISKHLRIEYQGTDLTAVTDEKWLGFIIEQLISNSLKYTEKGSVSICVRGRSIIVSDTGIGIAAADVPRIFERGYTGLNGRADNKSTGLGLYLVKKACKKLGAQVTVQSAVGKGTQVTVTLPEQIEV